MSGGQYICMFCWRARFEMNYSDGLRLVEHDVRADNDKSTCLQAGAFPLQFSCSARQPDQMHSEHPNETLPAVQATLKSLGSIVHPRSLKSIRTLHDFEQPSLTMQSSGRATVQKQH